MGDMNERRRRLRDERSEPPTADQGEGRQSRVSTVLAMVFTALLGVFAFMVALAGAQLFDLGRISALTWLLLVLYAATAVFSLVGFVLLIMYRTAAIITVTVGSVLGLLTAVFVVVGSGPGHTTATGAGGLFLLAVLALVQVRRADTRRQMDRGN